MSPIPTEVKSIKLGGFDNASEGDVQSPINLLSYLNAYNSPDNLSVKPIPEIYVFAIPIADRGELDDEVDSNNP